jgi:glutamyl-tRNA synthetase
MLRFAPSPTGDMHIGNLRVALMNYIVSIQRGESFLLRIEDTDKSRNIEGKDKEIEEILKKFAIHPTQTIYQSSNFPLHQKLAHKLLKEKKAFLCTCTEEELQKERVKAKNDKKAYRYSGKCFENGFELLEKFQKENIPFVIRIKKPTTSILFEDIIKGEISTAPNEVDSFVILRSDSTPTYNFACAVDDMSGGVSLIIRGEDHLSNTPKQIHIQKSLGFEEKIKYAHLPIILNEDGKKMSKRDQASSVIWLLKQGFLPDAIINYLLALGNKTPTEVFTLPEAIEWFDLKNISKSPAKFDINKLKFLNREHIKRMDSKKLSTIFGFADKEIGELAKVYLEECSSIFEIEERIKSIFSKKNCNNNWKEEMQTLSKIIQEAPMIDDFGEFKKYLIQKSSLKGKRLFKPLRILLTGKESGPELSEIFKYLKSYILEVARCEQS